MLDFDMIEAFYSGLKARTDAVRRAAGHPLTLSEKILYAHQFDRNSVKTLTRLEDYGLFRPDRAAMQDATAQMALLQFISADKDSVSIPASVHCDHLICACKGKEEDLAEALKTNAEVYDFLSSASSRYGIDFWKPGAGIIHQIVLENYAFPGGMMIGSDSHTPNAGGLGMIAVGVGGADVVDAITGMPWELKMPKIIGIRLSGELKGWASPKDLILKIIGLLTVKGGTNAILEYFGPGAAAISCTGKASICNMGAEAGATTSLFPYDGKMAEYLEATGRAEVASMAESCKACLRADDEVLAEPEKYYDKVIDIDLSGLEPHVNGPFTPDAACKVSDMKERVAAEGFPEDVKVSLIGSCTNSSYQDLARASSVAASALKAGLRPKSRMIVIPGSERIKATAERDGILGIFRKAGATIMANACGPCIGQWRREPDSPSAQGAPQPRNTIVTTFNRNFAKRADGNPDTHAFIVSPEMAVALAFSGKLGFNPCTDSIGGTILPVPDGDELPSKGFQKCESGMVPPRPGSPDPVIRPNSQRLQKLVPFKPWDGKDINGLGLLIKVKGKCTTDHISMAGPWLKYRGHLENISENLLLGAVDAFTGKSGPVAPRARMLRDKGNGSVIVAEDNYGEGSSREHAAMEPRYLGVRAIIAKSFARIHETNLKKQGVLALTFADPSDYGKVLADDIFDIGCSGIAPGKLIDVVLRHSDGTSETLKTKHTYNAQQIGWFKAGSALNNLTR